MNRLVRGRFDSDERKTEGIQRCEWTRTIGGNTIRVHVWDFGGQEIMHATHQFFLSERSLYVVVVSGRRNEDNNNLHHWLETSRAFGKDSPVLVVVNKIDQHPMELDKPALRRRYPEIRGFFATSCSQNTGIDELERGIDKLLGEIDELRTPLPEKWFEVKTRLEGMKESWLSEAQFDAMCGEIGIEGRQERETMVTLLHRLGVALSYPELRLKDTKVLRPDWMTGAVYKLVNDRKLLESHGVVTLDDLARLLDPVQYPADKYRYLVDVMKKFELCFTLDDDAGTFLIPDILQSDEPAILGKWIPAMELRYQYKILPTSVMSRFIARAHGLAFKNTYWRSGIVLERGSAQAIVRADRADRRITIELGGEDPHERADLLAVIRDHFDAIHKSIEGLEAELRLAVEAGREATVSLKHLLECERNGEPTYRPEGARQSYDVALLLSGVRKSTDIESAGLDEVIGSYAAVSRTEEGRGASDTNAEDTASGGVSEWSVAPLVLGCIAIVGAYAAALHYVGQGMALTLTAGVAVLLVVVAAVWLRFRSRISEGAFTTVIGQALHTAGGTRGKAETAPKKAARKMSKAEAAGAPRGRRATGGKGKE